MPAHRKNIVSLSFCVSQTEPENLTLAIIFEWLVTLHISHVDSLWQDPPFFCTKFKVFFQGQGQISMTHFPENDHYRGINV